ncbi:MAG TPA: hypothetical protein VIN03_20010 [Roseateles sp.]
MSEGTGSSFGRFIVVALLVTGTLGFGLAGLCGAAFTVVGLAELSSTSAENYAPAFLVISIPSLLIGGGLAWLCVRALIRGRQNTAGDSRP